ncbi:uncharacterized bromodomain-containing protein 10 isoform X2 [Hyperolius riggenbachi]|uniref:uncharacterized bromodomain-containing protein 10 isoform X2 n=1 Tax=Hyperolius riggenbachi TaxID=752182 RepID=UPI0035A2BFA3
MRTSPSRNLIDKTLAPTTSKSLSGVEEDKGSECPSTRRRSSTRNLANVNASTMESVMVQVLKQAEFLRAKEEKRLKEQERKEAEEASQKEMDEWDRNFLSLAAPSVMETMWEIPAIGHFLCLAQQILNLPEIVFYELERCLLMPQCNMFLSKIMTSLLSPPHRRPSLHRRPNLSYKAWESALRQKVHQWYTVVGQAENPDKCAEKLGLCSQFFKILGEMNPLEHKAFHELTFQQRVWLLKGICDFVYETQGEVQDAVLSQPIHECREVILGYDTQENAYIHFPQFCGADVRIYKQRPLKAPEFPTPSIKIKRIPKARLKRSKCKNSKRSNGLFKSVKTVVATTTRTNVELHDDCSVDYHLDSFVSSTGTDTKPCNVHEDQDPGDNKIAYSKGNLEKPSSPGELVGYGEPLSPGEIRILENVDKYSGLTLQKTDTSSLKENALKTFQVHVNGNHTNNTEVICHRLAMDIILDHSVLNQNMKLHKLRAKKKKKKKKMKDLFMENAQGLQHTFKSFKTEMHSKLYLNKKRVKHKKHKSGKKSLSMNMVVKKKKRAAASPATPEFQLVCTNLDDLRELIKKVDGELKGLENNKKKSGKWHLRKLSIKELHGTLTRLLNELLPWEPKLLKAFQRNRARLRKDYDDFLRLPESENFSSELCSREEPEPSKSAVPALKSSEPCHKDMQQVVSHDQLQNAEVEICGRGKIPKKDYISKYLSKSPTNKAIATEEKVFLPQKKIKLSTPEISSTFTEGETAKYTFVANSLQQMELEATEISREDHGTSPLNILKGSNPIQALLAKNIGNKVTLMSQLDQSISKPVPSSGSTPSLPSTLNPVKAPMPPLKVPLQMIYKLPDGQCVPVDLQSSSVKIQMQPVIGTKSGDKLMQQVLVLPRNLFIQQKDDKTPQETQPTPPDLTSQHSVSNMPLSSTITGQISSTPSPISKNILHSSSQAALSVSQPPISAIANCTLGSKCEISKSSSSVLPCNFSASVLSPSVGHSFPLQHDLGNVTSSTGSVAMGSQIASSSPAPQNDITEAKQELKTVCIRDSQSILVRTRGGNTGVVKVQQNLDKGTSTPCPIFTFTPQLQSFLVSRSKSSAPSNFSPVTPLLQTSSVFSNISSTSIGLNQVTELNTKSVQAQHLATAQKVCNPVQSNFLTTLSSTSTWPSTTSHATTNTVQGIVSPLSCTTSIQDCSVIKKTGSNLKLPNITTTNISTEQPDSTTPSKSDLVSGPSIHKVMLLTSPSAFSSDGSTNLGLMASPTLSHIPPKKFVFINTQLPGSSSNTNVALQPSKQAASATISKTFVKPTDQQQIFLIPSTMGSPVKISPPPIVSQVKDVKIGLTIGQTIVNTGVTKNVLPVNVLQTSLGKGNELSYKDFTVSSTPAFSKVQTNDQVTSSSSVLWEHAVPTTKGSIACPVVTSANPAQCTSTATKDKDFLRTLPSFTNLSSTANLGNTVAISTVKTGHLSSSVLLSTTQTTGHAKNASSSLQLPVSSALLGATSHLGAAPMATSYQPTLTEHSGKTQFTSQKDRSTNIIQTQATIAPCLGSSSCKTGPWHVPPQTLPPPLPLSTVNQVRPQFNESPTHQKLVINTSTPLAPGTQITINGTRFIVPSQGLTAGSHVLLLSNNTKQGPPLGSAQMSHGSSFGNTTTPQPAIEQSVSSLQIPVQSFKCTNASVLTKSLPNVQNASRIVNVTSATYSPCQLPSLENPLPTTAFQPLGHCIQGGSYPLQANMTPFSRGTSIKEGALFNTVSPPGNLLPTSTVSEAR